MICKHYSTSHMQSMQKGMPVAICNKKIIISSNFLLVLLLSQYCFNQILSNTDTHPIFISCLHNQLAMWHQQMCFSFSTLYQSLAPGNKPCTPVFLRVSDGDAPIKFAMKIKGNNLKCWLKRSRKICHFNLRSCFHPASIKRTGHPLEMPDPLDTEN